eukprot:COSAG02_NODE_3962_length_5981_cov_104.850731_8_plen_64_part_00
MVRTDPRGRARADRARRTCTKIGPDLHTLYVNWVLFLCKLFQKEISRNLPKKAPRLGMIRREF